MLYCSTLVQLVIVFKIRIVVSLLEHCQVCTDNASACKKAGEIIEERYPHITWSPCGAHVMDLLLEDIGKLPWVSPTIADGR
jgi:hypothetical protein